MNLQKLNERKVRVANSLRVGLDLASEVHKAVFMLPSGVVVGKPFNVRQSRDGLDRLLDRATASAAKAGVDSIVFGMEPTGPYWEPVARYLESRKADAPVKLESVFVSARVTKGMRADLDLSNDKNDSKDCILVGQATGEGKYSPVVLLDGVWAELRRLGSLRRSFIEGMTVVRNRIHSILAVYFPEREAVLKDALGAASLFLLERCPFPADVLELGVDGLCELVRREGRGRLGRKKAEVLLHAAETSVGVREGHETARLELSERRQQAQLLETQLTEVEQALVARLQETGYAELWRSIPGISEVTAACILAETGDPRGYSSAKEIVKLAGLNLVANLSGKKTDGRRRISRIGRADLRTTLYRAAVTLVRHNPVFRLAHLRKQANGAIRMKSMVAIMDRLIRVTFAMLKSGSLFESGSIDQTEMERLETVVKERKAGSRKRQAS